MRHHDRRDSGVDGVLERRKVDPGHLRPRMGHLRQSQMAVGGRVTVTGEVFGRREHSGLLEPLDLPDHCPTDDVRESTRRTDSDHWITRAHVDIGHGGEIDVHPTRAQPTTGEVRDITRGLPTANGISGNRRSEDHCPRLGNRHAHPANQVSVLLVRTDQKWRQTHPFRLRLCGSHDRTPLSCVARRHDDQSARSG